MPIYEYQCQDCDHVFEVLELRPQPFQARGGNLAATPAGLCPKCGGQRAQKLLSVSAVIVGSGVEDELPCGAGRACAMAAGAKGLPPCAMGGCSGLPEQF